MPDISSRTAKGRIRGTRERSYPQKRNGGCLDSQLANLSVRQLRPGGLITCNPGNLKGKTKQYKNYTVCDFFLSLHTGSNLDFKNNFLLINYSYLCFGNTELPSE